MAKKAQHTVVFRKKSYTLHTVDGVYKEIPDSSFHNKELMRLLGLGSSARIETIKQRIKDRS